MRYCWMVLDARSKWSLSLYTRTDQLAEAERVVESLGLDPNVEWPLPVRGEATVGDHLAGREPGQRTVMEVM